jgi:PAS domain S-box-containing protein
MRPPSYEKMTKKALIERLNEAERQLRTVAAERGPVSAPAERRRSGKNPASEEYPAPTSVRKEAKRAGSARPAASDIKSASESDYTILDTDGRIRRLYKVVKDIRDDAGEPVFSEGALYEISSKPRAASDSDHPDHQGESDQTELVCRFRPNGTLTFVNEAYCRYFSVEKEDLRDRNVLLTISESDREKVYSGLKDLRPERPVDTFEYRVATAFGDILWNQWTYRALFDDSGNILEYQSVGRDITFRKYTQDILEKRAAILEAVTFAAEGFLKSSSWRDRIESVLERFGAAMNASHVFLCENRIGEAGDIAVLRSYEWLSPQIKSDGNRKNLLQNSKLAVHFSRWVYEKSEGRPIYGTIGQFPGQDVGDLALDKKMSIAVMPVLMGERWWGFIGFADYSGDAQWTEEEISPLGAASKILGVAVEREEQDRALEETSEQQIRESRNMLRAVFDGISDPLIMIWEDMTLIMLNRAALGFFGAAQYREMIGTSCLEAFVYRYGREASNLVQSATAGEEPARYELETSEDSARYEEVFVYPVHAGGGEGSMAIIRITDRTKQRLMERELIQSEKLVALGLLISGIVHEINNPNNFISFNIPILRDYLRDILPVLDEHAAGTPQFEVQGMPYAEFRTDVMKLLENIQHGSTRINTTVAKLKEFSRKKDEKGARPILPASIVERAIAICHTQIRKTVKTFDVQVQQDMPEMVSDPDAIEQTLINLLINAAQAADKPDSHIRLDARQGASGKEGLVLKVEDNGCGMDAKTASRIFDPFFTTKEAGMGTGLGLYISKNLLESVGGSISVQSERGRGATFRVVIPDLGDPVERAKPSEKKGVDT